MRNEESIGQYCYLSLHSLTDKIVPEPGTRSTYNSLHPGRLGFNHLLLLLHLSKNAVLCHVSDRLQIQL